MKKLKRLRLLVGLLLICVAVAGGLWDYLCTAEVPSGAVDTFDLDEQMLPYFEDYKELVAIAARPRAVVVKGGKISIEFYDASSGRQFYVDPLAIKSEPWGEHPADKILRLRDQYGLSISRGLEFCLQHRLLRDLFFQRLSFEHRPGRKFVGVIAEVDIAGSFLVVMDPVPKEWRPRGEGYLAPSFFLVSHDRNDSKQVRLLEAMGFDFDPDLTVLGSTLFERIWGILAHRHGGGLRVMHWFTQQLRRLGVPLDDDLKLTGGFAVVGDEVYFDSSDGFWRDATKGKIFRLSADGTLVELYRTPGNILLFLPNPQDPEKLFISSEGYPEEDSRFGTLFEVDLRTSEWQVIKFPEPPDRELYATSGRFDPDGGTLLIKRYGGVGEGGGIWAVSLTDPNYAVKKKLIGWDHMLTWFPLSPLTRSDGGGTIVLFITAKEVADNFAMTLNRAVLKFDGVDSEIGEVVRIGKVVGWNPAPIHIEKVSENRYRFYVEAAYSYKAYAGEGGPFAVYVVEIQE